MVLRRPWLWAGLSRVVYLVDGCACGDRQGSEAGRARPLPAIARTLPSGVSDAEAGAAACPVGRAAATGNWAGVIDDAVRARLEAKGYRLTVAR